MLEPGVRVWRAREISRRRRPPVHDVRGRRSDRRAAVAGARTCRARSRCSSRRAPRRARRSARPGRCALGRPPPSSSPPRRRAPPRRHPRRTRERPHPTVPHQRSPDGKSAGARSSRSRGPRARLSRLRGGGATSAPGKLLLALEPNALDVLASRLTQGSVLVSATNGKTTTVAMARVDPRAPRHRAGAQSGRREHGWRDRLDAAVGRSSARADRGRAGPVRGRRAVAGSRSPRSCPGCARCCCRTCSATSSTATASSRRSPTAGSRRCATGRRGRRRSC